MRSASSTSALWRVARSEAELGGLRLDREQRAGLELGLEGLVALELGEQPLEGLPSSSPLRMPSMRASVRSPRPISLRCARST